MCVLPVRKVGRITETVRQMSAMQEDEILQQGLPKERLGIPPTLVCSGESIIHQRLGIKIAQSAKHAARFSFKYYNVKIYGTAKH